MFWNISTQVSVMGNTQGNISGIDQKELKQENERKINERTWFILVEGFIRNEKISAGYNYNWEVSLNHMILKFIVYPLFTSFTDSCHEGHTLSGSGMEYNLNDARRHALHLKHCVGFTYNIFKEKKGIALFHSNIHSSDLDTATTRNNICELYVFNSFCANLYIFLNDSVHVGNDLLGSGMKYDLNEAKDYGMRLKNCKGFTFDTWRTEREEKEGIAWFHSVILERDTSRKRNKLLPAGSQCLYIKRDWMPSSPNKRDIITSSRDTEKLKMLNSI